MGNNVEKVGKTQRIFSRSIVSIACLIAACSGPEKEVQMPSRSATVSNPCATKTPLPPRNPCTPAAVQPSSATKNPCHAWSGSAEGRVTPQLVTRPAGTRPYQGNMRELLNEGERLWNDRTLGTTSLSCGICHLNNGNFNVSFAQPYPHPVAITQHLAGLPQVTLEEMVQFCMVLPMAAQPLPWGSRELAALTAYSQYVQAGFIKAVAARPGALKVHIDPLRYTGASQHPPSTLGKRTQN